MRFQAVFFDLDGTLLDTSKGVLDAVDFIVEKYAFPRLTQAEKIEFIGPPIQDSFRRRFQLSREEAWELATEWREVYKNRFLLEARPYEGIYDALRELRAAGIRTGVATNKREDYTGMILDAFAFTPLFDVIAGTDFAGTRKKPDLIRLCMERTGVTNPAKCLMVGDTQGDLLAAQQAGVAFLGVTYGFGTFQEGDAVPLSHAARGIAEYVLGESTSNGSGGRK